MDFNKINTRASRKVNGQVVQDNYSDDESIVSQTDREIFELPGGCLGSTRLRLSCKGPTEKKFYSFSVKNRMFADDKIASVKVGPASDSKVTADKYTFQDQTFSVRLSGGELNRNVPIRCEITTEHEETLVFVCILPIREEGILYENPDGIVVLMGATGAQGNSIHSVDIDNDFSLIKFTMSDGSVQEVHIGIYKDKDGRLIATDQVIPLPDDFLINGSIYMAPDSYVDGSKPMPNGLSLDGNIVLTDGTFYYRNSWNNNGVLCSVN